jgi:GNAT superfamily N-acetyltransferase
MRSKEGMIRSCRESELEQALAVINDAAEAYHGVIPEDCWHEPYLDPKELEREVRAGVEFSCFLEEGRMEGVMGLQFVPDLWLIRHAYVRRASQRRGIGQALLTHLMGKSGRPLLVGTWEAASWAIRFYEKNGFVKRNRKESGLLLANYWRIPARQRDTSVVLVRES